MDMRGYQHYKEDSLNTMTQGELLILVYDELYKRLTQADIALEQKQYKACESMVERCIIIIRYLDSALDRRYPVAADLGRMYEFFCYELQRVKIGRNKTELSRVKTMVGELRDTFKQAESNVIAESKEGKIV